jgi:probable HAF family extracellular repeat protein
MPGLERNNFSVPYGRALAVDRFNGRVYIAGCFDSAGGLTPPPFNVAVWNDFEPITIVDLGSFHEGPDGYPDSAHGINNNGVAVGESYGQRGGGGVWQIMAYRWTAGTLLDLGVIGSGMDIWASAINDSGQIVGAGLNFLGQKRGARWTAIPTQPLELDVLPGGTESEASSLNAEGHIVGVSKNPFSTQRAVFWLSDVWGTGSNVPYDLGSLGGLNQTLASYAYGINAGRKIVGRSVTGSGGPFHAYRTPAIDLSDPANFHILSTDDLGTMSGSDADYSEAQAINDHDEVVGASRDSSGVTNAFLRSSITGKHVGFTDLGALSGHNYSIAYGINNAGQVVGYSRSNTADSDRAFLWQRGGLGMKNLNDLIAPGSGWTLHSAEWINESGKIVGWGTLSGDTKSFLLDPTK